MTQTHAPEPWAVQELTDDDWPAAIVSTQYWSEDDGEPEQGSAVIAQFISRELAEEFLRRYNALAGINPEAVPELLAACEAVYASAVYPKCEKCNSSFAVDGHIALQLRAAIAKATS